MDYRKFLERTRKRNGEKLLTKSIDKYVEYIDRYSNKFEGKDIPDIIDEMNIWIQRIGHQNIKSAFKYYLIYLGVDEEDEILNKLKSPKKRASALTSDRIMTSKIIPEKDLKFFIQELEDEWKLIIKFFIDTAGRENEILNIKFKDITYIEEDDLYEVMILGKGGKTRYVYIHKSTYDLLKKLRPNMNFEDKIFEFRKSNGELYKRQEKYLYDNMVKKSKKILGKKIHPHMLRHQALSKLCSNGGDLLGVSKYAGHSETGITFRYTRNAKNVSKNTFKNFSRDEYD